MLGKIIMSAFAAFAIGMLWGLRVNLTKTLLMCDRCWHEQSAVCVDCMAKRASYE